MKSKDKITVIVFIVLIILISIICIYHVNTNKKEKVDRKVKYIFDDINYDMLYINSKDLFNKGVKLLINKNVLIYEKNYDGKYAYFSINYCNHCKKIQNPMAFTNILTESELNKYIEENKIIKHENLYYIENNIDYSYNNTYIGSIIDLDSYDNEYAYFNSKNYYCDNKSYIGVLEEEPDCDFKIKETKFTIKYENKNLRLNNLEELKNIVK